MSEKYLLYIPMGGFNDILTGVGNCLEYCEKSGRRLLLDTSNGLYLIDFSCFFEMAGDLNICDSSRIKSILKANSHSVFPYDLTSKVLSVFEAGTNGSLASFFWERYLSGFNRLPNEDPLENILFYTAPGFGTKSGFSVFREFFNLKNEVAELCAKKVSLVGSNYISIHVRNTDWKSSYQELYEINKDKIHSYENLYVATDDKECLNYFRSKGLNVFCFTNFPSKTYLNLHTSPEISARDKIQDLLVDMLAVSMSNEFLSNSVGGFALLMKDCFKNKNLILSKYGLISTPSASDI